MNLEGRVEKLEAQIEEKEINISDTNLELFDVYGKKIDAKILRLPMGWEHGLAVLQDGTEKEIACEGNWRDIIFEAERLLNSAIQTRQEEQESQEDCLFLRRNGQISAVEEIISRKAKND